jgi:site-specific DNA recombinase
VASTSNNGTPKPVRCAIYTRKSTEEGLNQDFNSLDAQRDAGTAYIRSQAGEGWSLLQDQYDDGGYTGANMDRPAMRRLLADSQAGKVDCVVVYKVDRLSRSIRDFAKIMEIFEKHGTTFVSVTQQFNTTTSLGRLTLNILLSFAQFEREIISERTRDKQSAARKRGKWTGGHLILGYDLDSPSSRLVINSGEAERVHSIFEWYLAGESVFSITAKAGQLGWHNKQWTTRDGKTYGGNPLHRAHIYNLLANVLYTGRIAVDGELYRGEHEAIIDEQTFDLVQARLKQNSTNGDHRHRTRMESLLRGLIYCGGCGSAMYQTYSSSKERRYRYYVCSRAQQQTENYCVTRSVSAPAVEDAVVESIRRVSVHPRVLEETARVIRHRLTEEIARLREELNGVQLRVKNLKSQVARLRKPDASREAEFKEQIGAGEVRVAELKREILVRERGRVDGDELHKTMEPFEALWKTMNIQEQSLLLRQLVEKVGYDGRTGKVTVSFKSTSIKKLCQK